MNSMKGLKKELGEEVKEGRGKGSGRGEERVREWEEREGGGKKGEWIGERGLRKGRV